MSSISSISQIQLFNALKKKLGEVRDEFERKTEILATKEDLAKVEGRLETKIAQMESKLILWAFVFWVTQLGAIFAFIKFFVEK